VCLQQALEDFRDRIAKYEEVYETITDRNLHYIKLIDMCACWHTSVLAPQASIRHVVIAAPHHYADTICMTAANLKQQQKLTMPLNTVQGHWQGLHGREPHQRLHPWQDCVLSHAGEPCQCMQHAAFESAKQEPLLIALI